MKLSPFLFVLMIFFVAGCTTSSGVKDVDSTLDEKGHIGQEKIGIDKKGDAIVQEEVSADDELKRQEWVNTRAEEELSTNQYQLKRCREDLSDQRLGGDGNVAPLPKIDQMKTLDERKEQFGLNSDGELKVVRKEKYMDRLNRERKYEKSVRETNKVVTESLQDCEHKMGAARVAHGLPAKRYASEGYFNGDGTWVERVKAEDSLDDAFQRAKQAQPAQDDK